MKAWDATTTRLDPLPQRGLDLRLAQREMRHRLRNVGRIDVVGAERVVSQHMLIELGDACLMGNRFVGAAKGVNVFCRKAAVLASVVVLLSQV